MFFHYKGIVAPNSLRLSSVLLMLLFSAFPAHAKEGSGNSVWINYGLVNGASGEYVYDAYGASSGIPGYKISELQWELNSVPMVGFGGAYKLNDKTSLNLDYWVNSSEGDGTMDDYDWLYVGLDWSHWSHHENTAVNKVTNLDVNGEYMFYDFDNGSSNFSVLLGYRQDHFDWQSRGGFGVYSTMGVDYRDLYVTFPNTPGISYEQTYTTPYLGIAYHSTSKSDGTNISLDMDVRLSQWVSGKDVDIHHLRDLRFEEEGDGGKWFAFDISLGFNVTKRLMFKVTYSKQEYYEIESSTVVTDLLTETKAYYSGPAAGLDHHSQMTAVGLTYQF